MPHDSKRMTLLLGSLLLCFSSQLLGQPSVTHGTITVSSPEGVPFTLTTALPPGQYQGGWSVTGSFSDNFNWPAFCNPCFRSLQVGGSVSGTDFFGGSANFTGTPLQYYPSVAWGYISPAGPSYISISGPNIPLPANTVGTFVGPFTFNGALCGVTNPNSLFGPCTVLLSNMVGSGTVFITIGINQIGEQYTTEVEYVF